VSDNILQVSHTKLNMFSRCGEQYRRRYILGHRMPPSVSLLVGRAVDRSVTANLQNKIDTKQLQPLDVVSDMARDVVKADLEQGFVLSEEEAQEGLTKVKGEAIDKSVRLAQLHATSVAPAIEPVAVQRGLSVTLQREQPVEVVALLDCQEEGRVRDSKTSAKSPNKNEAHRSMQLSIYAMAGRVHDGETPSLVLDYLVDTKVPKAVSLETTRGPKDFATLLNRIDAFVAAHNTGVFMPTNPDSWWCSPDYCGYFDTCRYVRRPEHVALQGADFDLIQQLKASLKAEGESVDG
jgi:hypothetical protein